MDAFALVDQISAEIATRNKRRAPGNPANPRRGDGKIWKPREHIIGPTRFRVCQFIEGEPGADDACKCGQPTIDGAYCRAHRERVLPKGRTIGR